MGRQPSTVVGRLVGSGVKHAISVDMQHGTEALTAAVMVLVGIVGLSLASIPGVSREIPDKPSIGEARA